MSQGRSQFDLQVKNSTHQRFVPVEDPGKVKAFFLRAESIHAGIILWTEGKKLVLHGKYVSTVKNKENQFVVDLRSDQKELEAYKAFAEAPSRYAFVMVMFPKQVAYGIQVEIFVDKKLKEGLFVLQVRDKVYRAQRRKDLRLTIPKAYSVECIYPHPNPTKEKPNEETRSTIYDISVGGLSFFIPAEWKSEFFSNRVIRGFRFTIRSQEISLDLVIRNTVPGPDGLRAGASFVKIQKSQEDFLMSYITEHAMQMTSNFY